MGKSFFKYIFVIVVIVLLVYSGYKLIKEDSMSADEQLDQTSTVSTIQKDLRFAIAELDTINPILSNNRNVHEVTKIIYEPLVTLNQNYKLNYCLAEEIVKQDDTTYIVKLRKGVLWQNGNNFTEKDVHFTIDMIKSENVSTIYKNNLKYVTGYQMIDDYTFQLTLSQAVPFFEYNLTFPILSASYYAEEDFVNTDKNIAPIGTGMFKIDLVEGNIIKLVKNDTYWDNSKTPMAEEVIINLYSSMGEVYNAFKSGELDIITVTANNVEEYIGSLGYNKIEYKSREYDFLAFNTESETFSDIAVRQAISKIIDKDYMVVSCLGAGYVSSNFSLDMGNWLYTRDLTVVPNTEEATQILESNGWVYRNNSWIKDGKRLEMNIVVNSNNEARIRVAENISEQLNNFGIKVSVQAVSTERYTDALNNKSYECILAGIECSFSPSLHTFFGNGNLANYYNNEVLDLINKVENTTDESVLYDSYKTIFDRYLEDVPYIGLYRSTDIVVYNQGLVGSISPNAFNLYHNIHKWYRQ